MAIDSGQDWRSQLQQLRGTVEEREQQRAEEERLKLQRSRESLQERLRQDTPENLNHQLQELRKTCDRAARRFYPIDAIEAACSKLGDFGKRLEFYQGCQGQYVDLFTPRIKDSIAKCQDSIANIQRGLDRQMGQWRHIRDVVAEVTFRARKDEDDVALAEAAKTFSEQAHGMGLTIPSDFFSGESENFYVVVHGDHAIGHIKSWPEQHVVTLAFTAPVKLNFPKFVRGVLYKAYRDGPLSAAGQDAVRVRLGMSREVKFYTDLGFVRSQTVSVSEWVYERPLD